MTDSKQELVTIKKTKILGANARGVKLDRFFIRCNHLKSSAHNVGLKRLYI